MNLGLSAGLKKAFPNTKPVPRPDVHMPQVIYPFWLAGFVDGEGCFLIKIKKSITHKLGYQICLVFQIGQHIRDAELVKSFVEYLQAGTLIFIKNQPLVIYEVTKFSDIEEKIIPFFKKYPWQGVKRLEF